MWNDAKQRYQKVTKNKLTLVPRIKPAQSIRDGRHLDSPTKRPKDQKTKRKPETLLDDRRRFVASQSAANKVTI